MFDYLYFNPQDVDTDMDSFITLYRLTFPAVSLLSSLCLIPDDLLVVVPMDSIESQGARQLVDAGVLRLTAAHRREDGDYLYLKKTPSALGNPLLQGIRYDRGRYEARLLVDECVAYQAKGGRLH